MSVRLSALSVHRPAQGEFYSWAAFGYGLNATLLGRPVDTNDGGMKASLSSAVQNYANEVAHDEINHVRLPVFPCSPLFTAVQIPAHVNFSRMRASPVACSRCSWTACQMFACVLVAHCSCMQQEFACHSCAADWRAQVAFLRSALGANAVPCPTINVGSAFSAIVNAALGSKATSYNFSPYNNDLDFLLGARIGIRSAPT
jgi:hypothetical protein